MGALTRGPLSAYAHLQPLQQRYAELAADPGYLRDLLAAGALRARERAAVTARRAKETIGPLADAA